MTERDIEGVSALSDDEVAGAEFERLVDGLKRDEDLRMALARYRLISASLRGEDRVLLPPDFATGIARRLADEPTVLAPPQRRTLPGWARAAGGAAIAASVALVAVGLMPFAERGSTGPSAVVAGADSTPVAPFQVASSAPAGAAQPVTGAAPGGEADAESRLSRYLAEHHEFASRGGANGFMSYTTFVTYDGR